LLSRKRVEEILSGSTFNLTTLRAGIIVGSGSASFEIIRDLVEKLPVMIAPKWLNSRSQPLAVRNVIEFLTGVILRDETYNQSFDIGGPEILTYKQMLLQFAEVRGLKRTIISVPVMTPKLSSYWLYFVTSTSYKLAVNLVNSMKVEIICRDNKLRKFLESNYLHTNRRYKALSTGLPSRKYSRAGRMLWPATHYRKEYRNYLRFQHMAVLKITGKKRLKMKTKR
jgi:uncharacterized protein YbjT (DUF2867 family)